MSYSADLRATLEEGIAVLEEDIERLRRAIAALDATTPQTGPGARPGPRATRRRAAAVSTEAILPLLDRAEGATSAELAHQCGAPQARVLALLKELEAEGRARRTGRRRGTRWHGVGGSAEPDREAPAAEGAQDATDTELPQLTEDAGTASRQDEGEDSEERLATALGSVLAG